MASFERISAPSEIAMDNSWFDVNDRRHFWMQWRFRIMMRHLKSQLRKEARYLEVGCGNAQFRDQMEEAGYCLDGCDLNIEGLQAAREGKGKLFLYDIYDRNAGLTGKYDGVFLMDVIEHISDDVSFLKAAAEHGKPGSFIAINVPGNPALFSAYDVAQGHERRYNRESLEKSIVAAGLEAETIFWWGGWLVPLLWLRKLWLGKTDIAATKKGFAPPSVLVHTLLKLWMRMVTAVFGKSPFGTSVMALCRIPKRIT